MNQPLNVNDLRLIHRHQLLLRRSESFNSWETLAHLAGTQSQSHHMLKAILCARLLYASAAASGVLFLEKYTCYAAAKR